MDSSRWTRYARVAAVLATALLAAVVLAPDAAPQRWRGVEVEPGRYGPWPAATLDVYRSSRHTIAKGRRRPAVLVVHGGAWRGGSREALAPVAAALARAGLVAFNVDYPLSRPRMPSFPRALHVLRSAVRWIGANSRRYGVDPRRIGILGTSAGGHLGAMLAAAPGPRSPIRAAVLWSAPLDLVHLDSTKLRGAVQQFLGCPLTACRALWHVASPVSHVDGNEAPLLIVNSRDEIIPAAQAESMAARLDAVGSPHRLLLLEGRRHARAYADLALGPSLDFLRSRLLMGPRGVRLR